MEYDNCFKTTENKTGHRCRIINVILSTDNFNHYQYSQA